MRRVVIFVDSALDLVDTMYEALQSGQRAGLAGHLVGENPYPCECHRAQWERGWASGNAQFSRKQIVVQVG
jgi:ribosome modulation factor